MAARDSIAGRTIEALTRNGAGSRVRTANAGINGEFCSCAFAKRGGLLFFAHGAQYRVGAFGSEAPGPGRGLQNGAALDEVQADSGGGRLDFDAAVAVYGKPGALLVLEQLGYGQGNAAVGGVEDSVERLKMAGAGDEPTAARTGVENPDVGDADSEVVIQTVLELREGVVGREDFDADIRGLGEDLFVGFRERDDADIRDAIAAGGNLYSLLGEWFETQRSATFAKPGEDLALEIAVIFLTQVALDKFAINEIAVGPVGCCEVFFHTDQSGGAHK